MIMIGLIIIGIAVNKFYGQSIRKSKFLRDADLTLDGFIKALSLISILIMSLQFISLTSPDEEKDAEYISQEIHTGYKDGLYTGRGQGFVDLVTVEVTIENQSIVSIVVVDHSDDQPWFDRAYGVLPEKIIDKQSTDVDVVSSATYSSNGIIEAVKEALAQAESR